jgi:hypothetical protein
MLLNGAMLKDKLKVDMDNNAVTALKIQLDKGYIFVL